MRITLQQIADKLGVTKAAVSLALRNHPRISLALREKVQRVATEMGYQPDPFLARLSAYRGQKKIATSRGIIAWINHWDEPKRLRGYQEFENYWQGAVQASKRLGYELKEVIWPAGCPAKDVEQALLEQGVLGLLIPPHKPDVNWSGFDWSRFSLMRFGLSVRTPDSNLITADIHRALGMAVQKMHECGYRRIGFVYNRAHDRSIGGNYFGGFTWAQRSLAIADPIPPLDSETKTPELASQSRQNLRAWLKAYQPDAILIAAPETTTFLRELGYVIPDDLAVASTSPSDVMADAGIDQRSREIGRIAAEMLIKQISLNERGQPDDPCRILVECRWQDGKTLPRRQGV